MEECCNDNCEKCENADCLCEDLELTEEEQYEVEWDQGKRSNVRAKWTIDGAKTLLEAAELSKHFASYLEQLHKDGWTLDDPIDDDYGFIFNENPPKEKE